MKCDTVKFILFAHARSGSTSLAHSLNAYPGLHLTIEPFHHKYSQWHPDEHNYIDRITDFSSLEDTFKNLFRKYTGIKILDYQLPEDLYT